MDRLMKKTGEPTQYRLSSVPASGIYAILKRHLLEECDSFLSFDECSVSPAALVRCAEYPMMYSFAVALRVVREKLGIDRIRVRIEDRRSEIAFTVSFEGSSVEETRKALADNPSAFADLAALSDFRLTVQKGDCETEIVYLLRTTCIADGALSCDDNLISLLFRDAFAYTIL